MDKYILMIAYHFPPVRGSSGRLRTIAFTRYLQDHGWKPIVIAPNPRAYVDADSNINNDVVPGVIVHRSCAFNSAKHFSLFGRYFRFTALPDRWISWWPFAVISGIYLILRYRPKVIWSTYPITTAHLIGKTLHQLTKIPWIADFRDPMVYEDWPPEGLIRRINAKIEKKVVSNCNFAVFTTPSALSLYQERYQNIPRTRWAIIPNGYDEADFSDFPAKYSISNETKPPFVLLHNGLMEQEDRDPRPFFDALVSLRDDNFILSGELKIILRASYNEKLYQPIIDKLNLNSIVELAPPLPYKKSLEEMFKVHGLLLFQGPACNRQVPAKLYEYFRTGKPIFAITEEQGDTAKVLCQAGTDPVTPYNSTETIKRKFIIFLNSLRNGTALGTTPEVYKRHSRAMATIKLANLLEKL